MAHTHVKLDADLYPVYTSYKKATNAVVRWIATAAGGHELGPDGTKWSLKELRLAARTIAKSKCMEIPPRIPCAFQNAMTARKEISLFYKQHTKIDSVETKKHERFTETLKVIYKLLCGSSSPTTRDRGPVIEAVTQPPLTSTNTYDTLALVPTHDIHVSNKDHAAKEALCASDGKASHPPAVYPEPSFGLKDDGLADMFEIYYAVANLDLACTKIKKVWAKAAAGSIPIVFAAWLTTAAVELFRYQSNGGSFSVSLNATNHQELCDKYKPFLGIDGQDSSVARFLARDSAQNGVFSSGHGLFCPAEAIERGAITQAEENTLEGAIFENPEDFITVGDCADDRERQYGAESIFMDKILESMKRRLLASEEIRPELLYSMNPLIKDIRKIYRSKDNSVASNAMMKTNVVFGLQLLVESYKTFVFSDEKTHKAVNCRVHMLKFAQDVKNTLTKVRDFRPFIHDKCCPYLCSTRVLSSQIWALELDLMVLVKQKIFDLYYQAPWVAGSQMLEIMSRATDLGVRLCNRDQIVWAVLHLYNLLRQCGVLGEETILLEHLCSAIGKQVFRGDPPQRDFWTRYKVCHGGRLEFDRSKKHQSRDRLGSSDDEEEEPCARPGRRWRVRMPTSHTVFANDNHVINAHQTSIFAGLYSCAFCPSCVAWSYAWHGSDRSKFPSNEASQGVADEIAAHPLVFALDHLEIALGPELQGDFPMARLNWLEIFLTMADMLSEMGKAARPECPECRKSAPNALFWVRRGCCAVEKLMQRADECEDVATSDFGSECLEVVEPARNAICSAVRGKTTSDYFWNV